MFSISDGDVCSARTPASLLCACHRVELIGLMRCRLLTSKLLKLLKFLLETCLNMLIVILLRNYTTVTVFYWLDRYKISVTYTLSLTCLILA